MIADFSMIKHPSGCFHARLGGYVRNGLDCNMVQPADWLHVRMRKTLPVGTRYGPLSFMQSSIAHFARSIHGNAFAFLSRTQFLILSASQSISSTTSSLTLCYLSMIQPFVRAFLSSIIMNQPYSSALSGS